MYQLIRETPWVKEWQTPVGAYVDSKLRLVGGGAVGGAVHGSVAGGERAGEI